MAAEEPGRAADRRRTIIPAALRTPVRFLLPALVIALAGTLLLTPVASAEFWSPEEGGSPNADAIDNLYWILFALSVVVFVGVEGVTAFVQKRPAKFSGR